MAYQVVNPATGKLESEYPTATDAEISDVVARADAGLQVVAADVTGRAGRDPAPGGPAVPGPRGRTGRDHHPGDGQDHRGGAGRDQVRRRTSTSYYADNGSDLLEDQPLDTRLPRRRPGSARRRSGRCSASCRGTTRTTRWPGSRRPNLMIGNTIILKHAPQCPESALAMRADLPRRRAAGRRLHQRVRQQRAGRRHDRRPADRRGVGHRQRAGRGRGGRHRRAAPEEGRAGARRLGPVHRAGRRRPDRRWPRPRSRPGWRTPARPATPPSG